MQENLPIYDVAILLATRGRTQALANSILSIVGKAEDKSKIQLILGFDEDDHNGLGYFNENLKIWLKEQGVSTKVLITERYGYAKLNAYYNLLANLAESHWVMMWNDDAIMETEGWDREIAAYNGEFKVLGVMTHNDHPFSIFPIVPKMWIKILGQMSRYQEVDHECSAIGYMLDIFQRIPVLCTHDRADLTGNNKDETYQQRVIYSHRDKNDPNSFVNPYYVQKRVDDAERLSKYLKLLGVDQSWWESIKSGENKMPFLKQAANDPNKQTYAGRIYPEDEIQKMRATIPPVVSRVKKKAEEA